MACGTFPYLPIKDFATRLLKHNGGPPIQLLAMAEKLDRGDFSGDCVPFPLCPQVAKEKGGEEPCAFVYTTTEIKMLEWL